MGCGSSSEAMQSVRRGVTTRDNLPLYVREAVAQKKTWEIWRSRALA